MTSKTVTVPYEVALLIRRAFLPHNPNKMRNAAPEVVSAAHEFIQAVERPQTYPDPRRGDDETSPAPLEECRDPNCRWFNSFGAHSHPKTSAPR